MAELILGGIRLSDNNGKILNPEFLKLRAEGETRSRVSKFKGDKSDQILFVGVLPAGSSESDKNQAILLEVQDGEVSYTTNPGQISIKGKFYAAQPIDLPRGERFIYEGSLLLPIKTLKDEDRTSNKGYEITSLSSSSNDSDFAYLDPKQGLTFSSGGTKNKPSLRVDGELIAKDIEDTFSFIANFNIVNIYSANGLTRLRGPELNLGNFPKIKFSNYVIEAQKVSLEVGPFDSKFGVRLGGDFKLKSEERLGGKLGSTGRLKIVSPENFIEFGGESGFRFKGTFEISKVPVPFLPLFVIKKAFVKADTKDLLTFEFSADIGLIVPVTANNFENDDPSKSFAATIKLVNGRPDTLLFNVKGINYPLGSTNYKLTAIGGGFKDRAAPADVKTKIVAQTSLESISKTFGEDPDFKGDLDGELSIENFGLKGKFEFFPEYKFDALGIKGVAESEGKLVLDWNKGILSANVKANFLSDFLKGRVELAVDTKFNYGFIGELDANIPRTIPLIGGKNVGRVGAGFQFINDNDKSNDFAAAWFAVNLLFTRKQFGAKIDFNFKSQFLGAEGIAETRGTLDNTIGLIAKGDLDKSISTTATKTTERFLALRFDLSEFNLEKRLNIFEPIATASGLPGRLSSRLPGGKDAFKNGRRYVLPQDAVFLSDVAKPIPELSTPESSFYLLNIDSFIQKTGKQFTGLAKVAPANEALEGGFRPGRSAAGEVFRLDAKLFKIPESPDIDLKELREKLPLRPKPFLPVRFDRSELSFNGSPDLFEPIATFNLPQFVPGSISAFYFAPPRLGSSTKNGREYILPQSQVFLSDVAQLIPELSTPESSFYLLDLDLFRRKTGQEFKGFAKVLPKEFDRVNINGFRKLFRFEPELFNTTGDKTLEELKEQLQPKAFGSQPLAEGLLAGAASPNLFSMLTIDRGNKVDIAYDASDPDSEANITLYYDSDGTGANGIFITDGLKEKDGTDTYTWDTADVPAGTYYIYAVINDGDNVPVVSYLPDPIRILDPNALPQVQAVTGEWSGADTVELTWEPLPDLGLGYYVVSYTSIASGDLNQEESGNFTSSISEESSIRLTGLQTGEYYRFTVKAVNDAGEEGLPSEPIAILVGDRYTASLEKGEWEFSTHPGSVYVADLDLNQDQQAVLLRGPAGATIKEGRFIWEVPLDADLGTYGVSIQIRDVFGNESVVDRLFEVNDRETSARLLQANDSVFTVQGTNAKLEVTAFAPSSSKFVNELGVFIVDDVEGRIDGLHPLDAGYLAAAVKRSQVVLSLLTDNPTGFEKSPNHRSLSFADDTNVRFLLVKDGSLDDVRDEQVPLSSVLLSTVNTNTVTKVGNGQFKLQWEDGSGDPTDFQDLVVQIKATDQSVLLGETPQTKIYELFDFTNVTVPGAKIEADLVIYQSLAFDNVLGFYEVLNTEGAILDALTGQVLQPGTAGYETAAVSQRVASLDVVVNGVTDTQGTVRVQGEFSAGKQYAPFVIVNGLPEQLLDANTDNNPEIYFPYLGSSTDSFDRFRLLGQNVFGFEDWIDRDFNDIVVKGQFSVLV